MRKIGYLIIMTKSEHNDLKRKIKNLKDENKKLSNENANLRISDQLRKLGLDTIEA